MQQQRRLCQRWHWQVHLWTVPGGMFRISSANITVLIPYYSLSGLGVLDRSGQTGTARWPVKSGELSAVSHQSPVRRWDCTRLHDSLSKRLRRKRRPRLQWCTCWVLVKRWRKSTKLTYLCFFQMAAIHIAGARNCHAQWYLDSQYYADFRSCYDFRRRKWTK